MSRVRKIALATAVLGAAAVTLLWTIHRPAATPEMRGQRLAGRLGCFACHGPGGTGGVPNPGNQEGEVPGWTGGVTMMYVESDAEWREWILDGAPKRKLPEKESRDLLRMPAFRSFLRPSQIEDLVAYVQAVAAAGRPRDGLPARGFAVAKKLGCFGCHGPGGRTGSPNPRSFKGVIPPWTGGDFAELVRDDAELRAWILDGKIPRLEGNPLARFFTRRQRIAMPAYRRILAPGELDALVAYVAWIRGAALPPGRGPAR
ncbi:MAG: c-type cytochrome [bacterium]